MATVIQGGLDTFRVAAYGETSRSVLDSLADMGSRYDDMLTARARESFGQLRERIDSFSLESVKRRAKAAFRKAKNLFLQDCIRALVDVGQLQNAPDSMIPWLMAHPRVDAMYRRGEVEGYGERYKDVFNTLRGKSNPYYRTVMNGAWQEDENGNEYIKEYWQTDASEMLPDLLDEEVFDIRASWDKINQALDAMDDDPTSPYNAKL